MRVMDTCIKFMNLGINLEFRKKYLIRLAEDKATEKSNMPDTMNPFIFVDGVKVTTLTIYGQLKMYDVSYLKRYVQTNRLSII